MKLISTRDKSTRVTASQAILKGLSYEGGLFVPEEFPSLSQEDVARLAAQPYEARAYSILRLFLGDFTDDEIRSCVRQAYASGRFGGKSCAPLTKVGENQFFLELWHGPTCAFKDMALQILPHLMTVSAAKSETDKEIVILTATSGDTGKAALEGFRDVAGTRVMVFYPDGGVSPVQRLQMVTQEGNNVRVCGIGGNFDDAQNAVKAIFTDNAYNQMLEEKGYQLSSANSINWGRLVPQVVYYVSAYCDLLAGGEIENGETVNFVVPTGNFGNILAAYYAKRIGIPIDRLICASNRNKVLTDFINTGIYDKNREFMLTISPSMDILISSNLERLLFELSDCDDREVCRMMTDLRQSGRYEVGNDAKARLQSLFWAGFATDEDTIAAISNTFAEHGYLIDTHTAVAKSVYDRYLQQTGDTTKTVVVSTASPFKFGRSVAQALLGQEAAANTGEPELLSLLAQKSGMPIPSALDGLEQRPVRFPECVEKSEIKNAVSSFLNI